ncbi:MAG: hypothetical protein CL946_10685 [Ectothiorhodospiraceae bacterium]|nr:hypothetical protein [Ectothiorhodospiraceae bacterium]
MPKRWLAYHPLALWFALAVSFCWKLHAQDTIPRYSAGDTLFYALPTEITHAAPFSDELFAAPAKPKIGLVLTGGGARGLSQIGVLQALQEAGIEPNCIVGTSIGSIIGGLYAGGYSIDRLKSTASSLDWRILMRLSDETSREYIAIDQRPSNDRSIFTLRFDGLKPVLPIAVSNGQNLTNILNELALQGIYHERSFDRLRVPYRAISTDLYSGSRVVLSSGSLAEAMRASATVPVLYSPVMIDSMALVDGGLRSNIPTDVARAIGCDIVIVVNTVSKLRTKEEIANPLQTLDQVLNIVMDHSYEAQLADADFVVNPVPDGIQSTEFELSDSLVSMGYSTMKAKIPELKAAITRLLFKDIDRLFERVNYGAQNGGSTPPSRLPEEVKTRMVESLLKDGVKSLTLGSFDGQTLKIQEELHPRIKRIVIEGIDRSGGHDYPQSFKPDSTLRYCAAGIKKICEQLLSGYRSQGYSLATVEEIDFDPADGALHLFLDDGRIGRILVEGNTRTDPVVILREFPIAEGEVFTIRDARTGLENISGLNLFHHVDFEIRETDSLPTLVLQVEERSAYTLQFGLHINNERNAQLLTELRDANFFGTGSDLSILFFGGVLNQTYRLRYTTNRLLYTDLRLDAEAYYDTYEYKQYVEVGGLPGNQFDRDVRDTYDRTVYGAKSSVGYYIERFGLVTGGIRYEQQRVEFDDEERARERHRLVAISVGTTIDTQDKQPYPSEGVYMEAQYTSAQTSLGSEVAFSKFSFQYDLFVSGIDDRLTFHPRVLFGSGDNTMPMAEEFRLGGMRTFYGARENEYTGRQMFLGSFEIRYLLPVQFLFESYASVRYDLGRTWETPESIKFEALRHGVGFALGLDTPIGPADFAIGKSFYFQDNIDFPIVLGSTYLYFSIGVGFP